MKNHVIPHGTVLLIGIVLLFLGGCAGTEPSRFYTLSAMQDADAGQKAVTEEKDISIGIGPVTIPDSLKRPQIVTITSQNELTLAEFDRWAGSLEENISMVLAEHLSVLLNTDSVFMFPWKRLISIDYQVVVEIIRLDGTLGGEAVLVARWTLFEEDGKKILLKRRSHYREQTAGQDYGALVAAMSRTFAGLSREIAGEIAALK